MAKITFPCGCEINAAFTLAMCPIHYAEIRRQEQESEDNFRKFEEMWRRRSSLTPAEKQP